MADEAYGAALQALWCWRLQQGEKVSIQDITNQFVELNAGEKSEPDPKITETYAELQDIQDQLSKSLVETFKKHRRFVLR